MAFFRAGYQVAYVPIRVQSRRQHEHVRIRMRAASATSAICMAEQPPLPASACRSVNASAVAVSLVRERQHGGDVAPALELVDAVEAAQIVSLDSQRRRERLRCDRTIEVSELRSRR